MAKEGVPRDNRATVTLAGTEFEVEASNGACLAYSNEFRGKLEPPFSGNLMKDILVMSKALTSESDDDLEAAVLEHIPRLVWAMSFAAGGKHQTYERFCKQLEHESPSYFELAEIANSILVLADRTFFRLPNRPSDTVEPDAEQGQEG